MMKSCLFQNGACQVRADFHLHTDADKEFDYSGDKVSFADEYIERLLANGIRVGVIANHNKFDFEEYKLLFKKAKAKEIFLLPGVELSVNEGWAGVHTIVVFDPTAWLTGGEDRIGAFIASQFAGRDKAEYQMGNARSSQGLVGTAEDLDSYGMPYFLVFAHVEAAKGLWHEMFTRLDDWGKPEWKPVREKTLGFQKVRTRDKADAKCPDRAKVAAKLGAAYPAEVEGSDPKSLDDVGKGQACYLKIGEFSFDAVRFALESKNLRVSKTLDEPKHSHIKSISFSGGILDGRRVDFSPGLNAIIGVRGSGKSSLVEGLRYALEIPTGGEVVDEKYKRELVRHLLGSGGKIDVEAVDIHGQSCSVSRILGNRPEVFRNGELQPSGISIGEVVVRRPLCFGQKELSVRESKSENELLERLIGSRLAGIRRDIDAKKAQIRAFWTPAWDSASLDDKIAETEASVKTLEAQLEIYKIHGVEEKLNEQAAFANDRIRLQSIIETTEAFAKDMKGVTDRYRGELQEMGNYESTAGEDFRKEYVRVSGQVLAARDDIEREISALEVACGAFRDLLVRHDRIADSRKETFAAIERELSAKLAASGYPSVRPDDYMRLKKQLAIDRQRLLEFRRNREAMGRMQEELARLLVELSELHRREYQQTQVELEKINAASPALEIACEFRGDRAGFVEQMADAFRGKGFRRAVYERIADACPDFIQVYFAKDQVKGLLGDKGDLFWAAMEEQLLDLLLWPTPNKASISLRGKPLSSHSLGQRAAALIMFVMGLKENDVVIIDQPEDDLDSQTIYEDVIQLVSQLKPSVQFIFATHNANIPVLGDAEQVIVCNTTDSGGMEVVCGAVDVKAQQKSIVGIMEGGAEAFERRREIYGSWNRAS